MDSHFSNNSGTKSKKTGARRGDGFFEALREIGSSTLKSIRSDVVGETAKNIHDTLVNSQGTDKTPQTNPEFNFEEWINQKENEARQQERSHQEHKRREERIVFSFQDEKLKREIDAVRQELALLVKTLQKVETQVEKAVIQEIVDPGVYHVNFFHKLRTWLILLRRNLEDSSLWLDMWQTKSKKSRYWSNVGKSGTKYMLSQERYMSTQAG